MADSAKTNDAAGKKDPATFPYDPSALLSLYGMPSAYSGLSSLGAYGYPYPSVSTTPASSTAPSSASSTSSTLGIAASQAASLGVNQASAAWWSMASQLAAQDYLTRIQAAARDPNSYAALVSQGGFPMPAKPSSHAAATKTSTSTPTTSAFDSLRLPSDTEIIKYTSSATGPRIPGTTNRGRKKTISLDPTRPGGFASTGSSANSSRDSTPTIPPGLTIERKRPGGTPSSTASPIVDKVEITKIPVVPNNGTSSPRDFSFAKSDDETPLNLSMKSPKDSASPYTYGDMASISVAAKQIPSDYYASQALSGVFLAEQIRQQQLAAALESRLETTQSYSAMQQAAMLMSKLSSGGLPDVTAKLVPASATGTADKKTKGRGAGSKKSNTVASLLASKKPSTKLTPEELEKAERFVSHPELTIEPIFKSLKPDSDPFDTSADGKRFTSVVDADGKIRIKTINDSPEIRNLSDDGASGFESDDTEDDGSKHDKQSTHDAAFSSNRVSKYATVETDELKQPLNAGWRRETLVREYSKSGIRGEVAYFAPCGKRFKQYPDILRYLEKRGIRNLQREHFSFSTKIFIGDFLKPTGVSENGEEKYLRLSAQEMLDDIDKIRRENGWKPRKRKREMENKSHPQSEEVKLQREAMRILREAEKLERMEQAKRDREIKHREMIEAKRKKHEELARIKQEENLRKLQEREQKRHQAALIKEQERERRRQHMIFMKQLEAKKKADEREKRREEQRLEKERDRERRMEQKKLEVEIINEMKRPIEDMTLTDKKDLPELKRIPGMKLSGEALANILMVHEFLNNFCEVLGFDRDSLPTLSSLQAALLYDPEAEEEMLSVLIHLVVCAIEDPGIIYPHKHLTILGQTLRQADITNTNISEILRMFLFARAQVELRLSYGLLPPDYVSKDKRDPVATPHKMDEYNKLLFKTRPYEMSQWVMEKPFLCLNPTDKAEVLAFVCNELLYNKGVLREIENNVDRVNKTRKTKMELENKLKRLRMLHARKFGKLIKPDGAMEGTNMSGMVLPGQEHESASEAASVAEDDSMSVMSESTNADSTMDGHTPKKGRPKGKGKKGKRGRKKKQPVVVQEEEQEEEDEAELSDTEMADVNLDNDEAEETLPQEELQAKIEKIGKYIGKRKEQLTHVSNCLRANDLGQDRHRRRYWHLAHSGGIFVEGMESCEPWKLNNQGLKGEEEESKPSAAKKLKMDEDDDKENADEPMECGEAVKEENGSDEVKMESTPVKDEVRSETEEALRKLGSEILVTPKVKEERKFSPKITPNGDKLNLFNHSAHCNMSLSPVILNGSVTITPKHENHSFGYESLNVPHIGSHHDKPWFSLLPLNRDPSKAEPKQQENNFISPYVMDRIRAQSTPQMSLLEHKLELIKKMNAEAVRNPVPKENCYGWWVINTMSELHDLENSLHVRGIRESQLLQNLKRSFEPTPEEPNKSIGEELIFEELEEDESDLEKKEPLPGSAPPMDTPGSWSYEVALRVDKYILEQVEALEDKVAAASMQVPGWKLPSRDDMEVRKFRPSCQPREGESDNTINPIEEARDRLLELESAIERRYLKAPLGHSNADVSLKTITSCQTSHADSPSSDTRNDDEGQENGNDEHMEEDGTDGEKEKTIPRGLMHWREGVKGAKTAAQLAMGFYVLETSIAWHKSIMKANCQLCHNGDNEDSLLLCDGCDKGYHTYCFRPKLVNIPEGDWYCFECINKATGVKHCLVCGKQEGKNLVSCNSCPRAYHSDCVTPALAKVPRGKWQCPGCNHKGTKAKKARRVASLPTASPSLKPSLEELEESNQSFEDFGAERPRAKDPKKKMSKLERDMTACTTLVSELENSEDAWPFLYPVNTKQFPTYKKIIKQPMDIATIKKKLETNQYKNREDFVADVRLIFANCEIFNEDDSPVGKAGHAMRNVFETRWLELTAGDN